MALFFRSCPRCPFRAMKLSPWKQLATLWIVCMNVIAAMKDKVKVSRRVINTRIPPSYFYKWNSDCWLNIFFDTAELPIIYCTRHHVMMVISLYQLAYTTILYAYAEIKKRVIWHEEPFIFFSDLSQLPERLWSTCLLVVSVDGSLTVI